MSYSKAKTIWKALLHFCGALAAALSAAWVVLPADAPVALADWKVVIVPLALAAWRGIENYRKNSGECGAPAWEWGNLLPFCLVVCAVLVLAGCATQKITRLETHADGTQYNDTYRATSIPILGAKNENLFNFEKSGLNNVKAGSTANSDSTAMATMFTKFLDLLSGIVTKSATASAVSP